MTKKIIYLSVTILFNLNILKAQFGKIHYIIEYNKHGDTLACYEYNKRGLIKNVKLYHNENQFMFVDKLLKTHLYYEFIYIDSNEFSILTKEIEYGFIEKHSFCTCSDPYCDIDGCSQIEIELNIPYIESITEYFYSKELEFKFSKRTNYDTGRYIYSNCYSDSCLEKYKKSNMKMNFQDYDFISEKGYNKVEIRNDKNFKTDIIKSIEFTTVFSKNEFYNLHIWKICDCPDIKDIYDTLETGEFNFYKDTNNNYYGLSDKYGKIILKDRMPCCNNQSKHNQLIFYNYNPTKTENGYNIKISPFFIDQYPQKDIIKKIRSTKKSKLKIKRYLF